MGQNVGKRGKHRIVKFWLQEWIAEVRSHGDEIGKEMGIWNM